jgi:hypothetical protein
MDRILAAKCALYALSKFAEIRQNVMDENRYPNANDMSDITEISCVYSSAWCDVAEVPVRARVFSFEHPLHLEHAPNTTIPQWKAVVEVEEDHSCVVEGVTVHYCEWECLMKGVGNTPLEAILKVETV